MTRILVTGGGGYIGGRLLTVLAADPTVELLVATRRTTLPTAPMANLRSVDWQNPTDLARLCEGVVGIIHLISLDEQACKRYPEAAKQVNVVLTERLVAAACTAGVSRFLYVSTSKVFGDQPSGAIDETTIPKPESNYAITHYMAEQSVLDGHVRGLIEGVVLRLSNSVGAPADAETSVISLIANNLCHHAVTRGVIVLKSSGLAWRNFIAMADVITALRHLLALPRESLLDGLFHLGSAKSMRIHHLAELISHRAELLLGKVIPIQKPEAAPDEHYSELDWSIAKLVGTGWHSMEMLDREIDETLRFYRDRSLSS